MKRKQNKIIGFYLLAFLTAASGCSSQPPAADDGTVAAAAGALTTNESEIETADKEPLAPVYKEAAIPDPAYIWSLESYKGGDILAAAKIDSANLSRYFTATEITDSIFARMYGLSFKEDCTTGREALRYIKVLHYGFDGEIRVGEIIAHESIAEDLTYIFAELFKAEYPIEKLLLIDEYQADDHASMLDNNSSCFNFRRIAGSGSLSRHSLGLAIDINPLYNPYIRYQNGHQIVEPAGSDPYANRDNQFPYKIDTNDLCYQLFISRGFTWGGSWNSVKDYQHFEKDLPEVES